MRRTADPDVFDNEVEARFEILADGAPAGFAQYERRLGVIVFTHTEIDPAFEGRGLGGRLAKAALDEVGRRAMKASPVCSFIAEYIQRHPGYSELVASD